MSFVLASHIKKLKLTRFQSGTPAQITRNPEDISMLTAEDNRSRKRNTPGDQNMRRTIQDLVSSVDPNVKIEPEVEDVCGLFFGRRICFSLNDFPFTVTVERLR